ncbi:MAG: outer membrane beta-barrel protein [Bacteroidales bacterium]|jgi:outer membrane receptor for ferrienterochelin and colicin|nr:outer membrane beta-barrel protein [Bacteroidales bacterium]MDD4215224.1 outer membrane beta-barrel protein [Bacteroidales bacterium]
MNSILKNIILTIIFFTASLHVFSQNETITGTIRDIKTKETIVGVTVMIEGTTIGVSSDLEGNYKIGPLKPGLYNIIISYISYKKQLVPNVKVEKGKQTRVDVDLEEVNTEITGVTVIGTRRHDSEISMISSIKFSDIVVSGISSQQISKSQDKDAAEVVRRIPGITILSNRFIVVRGLNERYNTVWLNNASTPSLESDVKAFSFDLIPSSLIDNIMVYKTPAPELPGDFAGAALQIYTKNIPEKDNITVSYGTSFLGGTTFKTFYEYEGGKWDALGFDDGTRALPENFPDYNLNEIPRDAEGKLFRTEVGRMLNKIWEPHERKAINDNKASLTLAKKFKAGKSTFGNITAINYSDSYSSRELFRANYLAFDRINEVSDTAYYFNDNQYTNTSKINALVNWSFKTEKGHTLELRNLFNQIGASKTTLTDGRDNYGGMTIKSYELDYSARTIYSGQLGGKHPLKNDISKMDWTIGYSYARKNQPDIRRITSVLNEDSESPYYNMYGVNINFAANSDQNGRIFMDTREHLLTATLNFEQKFHFGKFHPEIKAGLFYEYKSRKFDARLLGFAIAKTSSFNWEIPYMSIAEIFADTNINATTGIKIDEQTNSLDKYNAGNDILAAYLGFKIPFLQRFNLYAGLRMEKYHFTLSSGSEESPVSVKNDTINFFPSANLSYNINEKNIIRFAYGQTINHPEFREVAPFNFYVYELKAYYKGNPSLKSAYIHNVEFRYEYYPSLSEILTIGAFYKKFKNPVEATMYSAGSGWDYTFVNAVSSYSFGAELDMRKSFANLAGKKNFLRHFKDFTLVLNASLIKSEVTTDDVFARERKRAMQGQSPFIVNLGIYYQNDTLGLGVSLLYNVIGKRIIYVGNVNDPHTYEMPRNILDFSVSKSLGKHVNIKFGINDILNQKHRLVQTEEYQKDTDGDGTPDKTVLHEQTTRLYKTGRYYSLGISVSF